MFVGSRQRKTLKSSKSFASRYGFWSNTYNFLNKGGWQLADPAALISTLENSQMKKTLIAMAAVAVAGVASAQVTITGKLGVAVRDSSVSAKEIVTSDSGVTFSATEDLGGGLSASASMTTSGMGAHGTDVGADGSSLTLAGGFGSISWMQASSANDMLGVASGLKYGGSHAFNKTADSGDANSVGIFHIGLPELVPGLTATVRLANGATANAVELTNEDAQLRLGYKVGDLALTYNTGGASKPASDFSATYTVQGITLKYAADITRESSDLGKRTGFSAVMPVGGLTVSASTESQAAKGSYKKASATEFNVAYALSKRTSVNAAWGSFTNTAGAERKANTVKMVHTF